MSLLHNWVNLDKIETETFLIVQRESLHNFWYIGNNLFIKVIETPLHIFKKFPVTDFLSLHDWSSSKEATWGTTYNSVIFTYY